MTVRLNFLGTLKWLKLRGTSTEKQTFSKVPNAIFELPDADGAQSIKMTVWDYKFGPVSVHINDGEKTVTAQTPGELGLLLFLTT